MQPHHHPKDLHTQSLPTLSVEQVKLSGLREQYTLETLAAGLSSEQLALPDPRFDLLFEIFQLSQSTWQEKQPVEGVAACRDTPEVIASLFTEEKAIIRLLYANEAGQKKLIGAGLALTGDRASLPNDPIPEQVIAYLADRFKFDKENSPPHLIRGMRLYLPDIGNALAPKGQAINMLLSGFYPKKEDEILVTEVLAKPEKYAHSSARRGYLAKGFVATGITAPGRAYDPAGDLVDVEYEWFVYDPTSDKAIAQMHSFNQALRSFDRATRHRLSPALGITPHAGQDILVLGGEARDGFHFSELYPRNQITFSHISEVRAAHYHRAPNLVTDSSSAFADALNLPRDRVNIINCLQAIGSKLPYALLAEQLERSIKPGGTLSFLGTGEEAEVLKRQLQDKNFRLINEGNVVVHNTGAQTSLVFEKILNPLHVKAIRPVSLERMGPQGEFSQVTAWRASDKTERELLQRVGTSTIDFLLTDGHSISVRSGLRTPLTQAEPLPSGAVVSPFTTEQLALLSPKGPDNQTCLREFQEAFGLPANEVSQFPPYISSATELDELVYPVALRSSLVFPVDLEPDPERKRAKGRILSQPMYEYLQAGLSGAHLDERTSRMIRMFLLQEGRSLGAWTAPKIHLREQSTPPRIADLNTVLTPSPNWSLEHSKEPVVVKNRYHQLYKLKILEQQGDGQEVPSVWEVALPSDKAVITDGEVTRAVGTNKASLLPVGMHAGEIYIGLRRWRSEAVRLHSEEIFGFQTDQHSAGLEYSLPRGFKDVQFEQYLKRRIVKDFPDTSIHSLQLLGGSWTLSSGISPKVYTSGIVEVDFEKSSQGDFMFVPISEVKKLFSNPDLFELRKRFIDGPTLTNVLRLIQFVDDQ